MGPEDDPVNEHIRDLMTNGNGTTILPAKGDRCYREHESGQVCIRPDRHWETDVEVVHYLPEIGGMLHGFHDVFGEQILVNGFEERVTCEVCLGLLSLREALEPFERERR